ncbi:MAG: CHAT domain-containing tetratricopeptide repeat protein [Chloroflexota bacterium]
MNDAKHDYLMDLVQKLCNLLDIDYHEHTIQRLLENPREQFEEWKAIAQKLAISMHQNAKEGVLLMLFISEELKNIVCTAIVYWTAGNVYYLYGDGDMKRSNLYFTQADRILRSQNMERERAWMSLGWIWVLAQLGKYPQSIRLAKDSGEILSQGGPQDQQKLADLSLNMGMVYESMGLFDEALKSYARYREVSSNIDRYDMDSVFKTVTAYNSTGITLTQLGQYEGAQDAFDKAEEALLPHKEKKIFWVLTTRILMNKAWMLILKAPHSRKIENAFAEARNSRNRLDEQLALQEFCLIDLYEAEWLIHVGQWEKVKKFNLQNIQESTHESGMSREYFYSQLLLTQIKLCSGDIQTAIEDFGSIKNSDFASQNPEISYLATLWLARAFRAQNNIHMAKETFATAIQDIEQVWNHMKIDMNRMGYLEDKLVAYHELIELHLQTKDYADAFNVIESCKSKALVEILANQHELSVRDEDLLRGNYATIEQIADCLDTDTLVINFAVVRNMVWGFLIDSSGLIEKRPFSLYQVLSSTEWEVGLRGVETSRMEESQPEALTRWYTCYFAPLESWLERYENIVISPDGLLSNMPIPCLYNEKHKQYFSQTHTINVVPNITAWLILTSKASTAEQARVGVKLLAVGNSAIDDEIDKLPNTIQEATWISGQFANATLLIDKDARKEAFTAAAEKADLIYIAAHGQYKKGNASASFVQLANEYLTVTDISSLQLKNPIVIINACETGRGYLIGNEMMGLVRAFLYAGATSVVANHWEVEDQAAFLLMSKCVSFMKQGSSVASALRQAQQALMTEKESNYKHPYFWGAPSVFGADRQL